MAQSGIEMTTLSQALIIAVEAFDGKIDRQGKPQVFHSLRVSALGSTDDERIVGALHDVVEDTDWTIAMLERRFLPNITEAVNVLTRIKGEPYQYMLGQVKRNHLATEVKLHDLADNLARVDELPESEASVLRLRYKRAVAFLTDPR